MIVIPGWELNLDLYTLNSGANLLEGHVNAEWCATPPPLPPTPVTWSTSEIKWQDAA
jgi:hypothetical protein